MKTIQLSKTGELYTETESQQAYRADNVLQVIGEIFKTCPAMVGNWHITESTEKPWVIYTIRNSDTFQATNIRKGLIKIIKEVQP